MFRNTSIHRQVTYTYRRCIFCVQCQRGVTCVFGKSVLHQYFDSLFTGHNGYIKLGIVMRDDNLFILKISLYLNKKCIIIELGNRNFMKF